MNNKIKNNFPNILTFMALFFDCLGILLVFRSYYLLSFAFIIVALIFDIFDGTVARYFNIDSSLGRQLDSFVDVMTYILYPVFLLYFAFSWHGLVFLLSSFIFIAAGMFRLARFNTVGFIETNHEKFYIGMPVFYNLFIPIILFLVKSYDDRAASIIGVILLLVLSFCMVQRWPFYKPNKKILKFIIPIFIILIIIIIYEHYSI